MGREGSKVQPRNKTPENRGSPATVPVWQRDRILQWQTLMKSIIGYELKNQSNQASSSPQRQCSSSSSSSGCACTEEDLLPSPQTWQIPGCSFRSGRQHETCMQGKCRCKAASRGSKDDWAVLAYYHLEITWSAGRWKAQKGPSRKGEEETKNKAIGMGIFVKGRKELGEGCPNSWKILPEPSSFGTFQVWVVLLNAKCMNWHFPIASWFQ